MDGVTKEGDPKNVCNIEAGRPFAKTLARYLLQQSKGEPEALARYRILLPTRRACRVLRDSFLSETGGSPLLLPRMTPIGDVEEEDLSLMTFGQDDTFMDIPKAVAPLKRKLLLARLIMAMPDYVQGYDHALALAEALCSFLDHIIIERLDVQDLHRIVSEDFAAHWQITLDFLKILSESWPKILEENDVIDVAHRRNILLQALADHWRINPPSGPVIAAGSTGSIPATANLLSVITGLEEGMIVLPGLDTQMNAQSWEALNETHPQFGLKQLLDRIGVEREVVCTLLPHNDLNSNDVRTTLASEMMRPSETAPDWKLLKDRVSTKEMLKNLQFFVCETQQEEAQLIAVLMRATLEEPGKTVALVTPDRTLARRVASVCKRWQIEVDDSAGQSFSESKVGKFLQLLLQAAHKDYDVISFLAFLKHSLCGADQSVLSRLELSVLRQEHPPGSFEMLQKKTQDLQDNDALNFVQHTLKGLQELHKIQKQSSSQKFSVFLKAHIEAAEFFASKNDGGVANVLWSGDEGSAASVFFTNLQEHAHLIGDVSYSEYGHILKQLLGGLTIRDSYGLHPRVSILGQLEARLTEADFVILGGLNEGSWPPSLNHDPWMSRPMRSAFGLPAQERAIGMAAHDFAQGFCAGNVVMTRARRVEGTPTVPSRWLARLDTVLKACDLSLEELAYGPALSWARHLDMQTKMQQPYIRPEPKPPVNARPKAVSVTKVETWLQDPYAIYAYYTLCLRKIRPLAHQSDAALRGQVLHAILDDFITQNPITLPPQSEKILQQCARNALATYQMDEETLNFWWPRFERLNSWFLSQEKAWREQAKFAGAELTGEVELDVNGQSFRLYGRADRIDRMAGGYALIDYKTGGTFTANAIKRGLLPQLPLEALILKKGRFAQEEQGEALEPGPSAWLGYWKMTGGQKAGEVIAVDADVEEIVQNAEHGLRVLVEVFQKEETPFLCVPDSANIPRFNDYEHLSRLKEWTALDGLTQEFA